MTLHTNLQRPLIALAISALTILSSAAHADCQQLLASEPGYRAETTLTFPSEAAESEFRRTLEQQAGLNLDEARVFVDCIKIAARHDDKDTLSQLVRYPLPTHTAKGKRSIRTPIAFKKAYPLIFNATVKHAIEVQRFEDLFVSYRGLMIGSGEVWISGIVEPASRKTTIKIITINNQ